jgi:hypothetical protein
MSYPEQDPQEPRVLAGYFSPAVAPPSALSQPLYPASFLVAVGRF